MGNLPSISSIRIFGLVFLAAFCLAFYSAVKPQQKSNQHQQETDKLSESSTAVIRNEAGSQKAGDNAQKTPPWYRSVEWSNWALVAIAGITAWAIWKQAKETALATDAMERSVKLQEIAAQQWLLIDGWRLERDLPRGIPNRFDIAAEVMNPTPAPVTLFGFDATVSGFPFENITQNVLGPNAQDAFKMMIPVVLTPEQKEACQRYALSLVIKGKITYTDASGIPNKYQPFAQSCVCGPDGYAAFTHWQMISRSKNGEGG